MTPDTVTGRQRLPPALRGAFVEEPRWVDLRSLHDVDQVDQSNPRLRECVADVAAAVREVPKDDLVGEHIPQHRRTMRLARGGVATLAVLLIAALVAAVVAVQQRATAQAQRDDAVLRQVSGDATRLRGTDQSLAAKLSLVVYRMRQIPDIYTRDPDVYLGLVAGAYTPLTTLGSDHVTSMAYSPDGRILAIASASGYGPEINGTIRLWNVTDSAHPTLSGQLTAASYVESMAFSPDGRTWPVATATPKVTARSDYGIPPTTPHPQPGSAPHRRRQLPR